MVCWILSKFKDGASVIPCVIILVNKDNYVNSFEDSFVEAGN